MSHAETRPQPPDDERLLISIPEAAARLGLGVTTLYELRRAGELRTVVFGRRRLVAVTELERLVAERTEVGA